MSDRVTCCDIMESCKDCPRYGIDCDGDKRTETPTLNEKHQLSAETPTNAPTDLISREDAMGAVQDHFNADGFKGYDDGQKMMDRIKALPSADTEWVPCSERLPEKGELVLVTVWNDVTIAWRNIYGGWDSAEDMYEKGDVIAWMPLPKPYREESEVEE